MAYGVANGMACDIASSTKSQEIFDECNIYLVIRSDVANGVAYDVAYGVASSIKNKKMFILLTERGPIAPSRSFIGWYVSWRRHIKAVLMQNIFDDRYRLTRQMICHVSDIR